MQSYRSVGSATDNTESTCKNSTFDQKNLYEEVPNFELKFTCITATAAPCEQPSSHTLLLAIGL